MEKCSFVAVYHNQKKFLLLKCVVLHSTHFDNVRSVLSKCPGQGFSWLRIGLLGVTTPESIVSPSTVIATSLCYLILQKSVHFLNKNVYCA